MKEEFLKKLTSRKLWLALAGVATGVALAFGVDSTEIGTVAGAVTALFSVATYVVTEGTVDIRRLQSIGDLFEEDSNHGDGETAA